MIDLFKYISNISNINESAKLKKIPEVLYHATSSHLTHSIKKYGLGGKMPRKLWWDYEGTSYEHRNKGVFLADDEYVAYDFLDSSEEYYDFKEEYDENHEKELEIVVYKIKASDLDKSKLSIDANNNEESPTYFYDGIIPYSKLTKIDIE
jgi:hypothetical protein